MYVYPCCLAGTLQEIAMVLTFEVPDMSCQHCVNAITTSIRKEVEDARVDVNLDTHHLVVCNATDGNVIARAIEDAGYTARAV